MRAALVLISLFWTAVTLAQAASSEGDESVMLAEHRLVPLGSCDSGKRSFAATVHPLVRATCYRCHDLREGRLNGPRFALADPLEAYAAISRYVNFNDLDASIFITKGGNQHCSTHGIDCGVDVATVRGAVQGWWDGGERSCPRQGRYVTPSLPVPPDLPSRAQGFASLRWDLGALRPELAGATLELEAQTFVPAGDGTRGAYRFRKPRLTTADGAIRVGDLKILVNDKFDPLANAYTTIERVVRAQQHPVLTSKSMIVLRDLAEGDLLRVSFEKLDPASPQRCHDLSTFLARVKPVLAVRGCYTCHGGGEDREAGRDPARSRFPMAVDDAELCASFLERAELTQPTSSALIEYPLRGMNEHPRIIPRASEIDPAWTDWLASEERRLLLTYEDVKPIFAGCIGCHGGPFPSAQLDLSVFPFVADRLGDDQAVVVTRILDRLRSEAAPMPPSGRLPDADIELVQRWLDEGLQQ